MLHRFPRSANARNPLHPAPAVHAAGGRSAPRCAGLQCAGGPAANRANRRLRYQHGRITCKLFEKEAPATVANFVGLADGTIVWTDPTTHKKMRNKPLYNGTVFHRVIPEFMIQGGDPTATGTGDPGYSFKDEFNPDLTFNVPGRLAMANSGPDTNGSQFFITEVPVEYLNGKHTIFGQCDDSGIAVVKSIARVQRDSNDKPVTDVVLTKLTIVPDGKPLPPPPASPPSTATTTPKPNQ